MNCKTVDELLNNLLGKLTGEPGHDPGDDAELTGSLLIRDIVSSLHRLKHSEASLFRHNFDEKIQ